MIQSWKQLVGKLVGEQPTVDPEVFYNALTDQAEPDFAKEVKCIDAEKSYTTIVDEPGYEMPLGVVEFKTVVYKGNPLIPINVSAIRDGQRYFSDGTTLRTGTPFAYFIENDRIMLLPAPTEAANLRVSYFTLPTYATKQYRALVDTDATTLYLDLPIGADLATDTVVVTNLSRSSLTGAISAYELTDDRRHKYTVASIAGQVEGDVIQIPVFKYVPSIPEIFISILLPYARAVGFNSKGDLSNYLFWMGEYERLRDKAAIDRAAKAYPDTVFNDTSLIG